MYYKITSELYDDDGNLISTSVNHATGLPNPADYSDGDMFLAKFDIFERNVLTADGIVREQMQQEYVDYVLKKRKSAMVEPR